MAAAVLTLELAPRPGAAAGAALRRREATAAPVLRRPSGSAAKRAWHRDKVSLRIALTANVVSIVG